MTIVLFACVHNAGRSQMAAAFFNAHAEPSLAQATSAGTDPADRVHGEVIEAMREIGIDLSSTRPCLLTAECAAQADLLITMGCGEVCPFVPGLRRLEWSLPAQGSFTEGGARDSRRDPRSCRATARGRGV